MRLRNKQIRRLLLSLLVVIFAVSYSYTGMAGVRLPEEEKAAEALKKALNISDDVGSSVEIENNTEENARRELLSALETVSDNVSETQAAAVSKETVVEESEEETDQLPESLGEYSLELDEENGWIRLNAADLEKIFPNMTRWSGSTLGKGDHTFEYVLRDSLSYATSVASEGKSDAYGGSKTTIGTDEDDYAAIIVQDGPTHICGYAYVHPENLGNGRWRIPVNVCDYDFEELYLKDVEGFKETENWVWIEPNAEAIASCGAEYFTRGYNDTSNNHKELNHQRQRYFIWQRGKEQRFNTMDRFPEVAAEFLANKKTRSMYFAFYDKEKNIIGYTNIIGSGLDTEALKDLLQAGQ